MPRAASYDEDDEPIEGYRLLDFLGKGQFGEVWKAIITASGKEVALKFIDLSYSPAALKELRALRLTINLRNSHLIPLNNAWLKDFKGKLVKLHDVDMTRQKGKLKELIIEMGLGEKSLAARLKEVNPDGTEPDEMQGIPTEELLEYMIGAAKGIDFLNQPDHKLGSGDGPIIHCDIKPDNMMIVSGEVQIADCGVAVALTENVRITKAAFSAAYGAPESIANKPVPGTDQYSLAISYYELRTGRLPFPDQYGIHEILAAHANGRLNFSSHLITDHERTVLKWATSLQPRNRYLTCLHMVKQLDQALNGMAPLPPTKIQPAVVIANPPSRRLPAQSHPVLTPVQPQTSKTDERAGTFVIGGGGPELVLSAPELSNPSSAVIEALQRNFPVDESVINLKKVEVKPPDAAVLQPFVLEPGSGHAIPIDPDDPLGDSHPRAVLDRELLGLTMTPNPPSFPLPPPVPAPATVKPVETRKSNPHPRRSNPRETPLPLPPEPQKDPSWLINAKQEEVKSRSTPNVAWNRQIPAATPNKKPLVGIVAGILVVLLLGGGGLFLLIQSGSKTETTSPAEKAIVKGGDGGTTPPTKSADEFKPKPPEKTVTNDDGNKTTPPKVDPSDVAKMAFEQTWKKVADASPVTLETTATDAINTLASDPDGLNRFLQNLLQHGTQKPDLQPSVSRILVTDKRFKMLPPEAQGTVFAWHFHAVTATPVKNLYGAFGVPQSVDAGTAIPAVKDLLKAIEDAKKDFDTLPLPSDPKSFQVVALSHATKAWLEAVEKPNDATVLKQLQTTVTAEKVPPLAGALAMEYMRLGKQPIGDLKAVRNRSKDWTAGEATATDIKLIDTTYQVSLGNHVRNQLNQDAPNWARIAEECDKDHANGWANTAALEAKLSATPQDRSQIDKLLSVAREASKLPQEKELLQFEKYLNFCYNRQGDGFKKAAELHADGLVQLYQTNPPELLNTVSRKANAAKVLFEAAKSQQVKVQATEKEDVAKDFAKNPYPTSGNHPQWLQTADELTGKKRSDIAMHRYLVKEDSQLLDRGKIDETKLADDDLDAALAFFALKAKKSQSDDQKLIASSQAARCAIRVMDRERTSILTDTHELKFNRDYAGLIRKNFVTPDFLVRTSTEQEVRAAKLRLQLADYQFETYRYAAKPRPSDEVAKQLRELYDELPDNSSDKMEALACHAYATLWRFVKNGNGDLVNSATADVSSEERVNAMKVWQQLIQDAETATKANPSPYLAHVTLAWVGGTEFGSFNGITMPVSSKDFYTDQKAAIAVSKRYQLVCEKMGDRKATGTWAARSKHLFLLANAIAKSGGKISEVQQYLEEALISNEKSNLFRDPKRYIDANQRGLILEDLAWFCRVNPKKKYEQALEFLTPAIGTDPKDDDRIKYRIDIGRCNYRSVIYGAPDQNKLIEARASLQTVLAVLKKPEAKTEHILQARYWLARIELHDQKYDEAEKLLAKTIKDFADDANSRELVTLTVAMRAKLALDRIQNGNDAKQWRGVLADCISKLGEIKDNQNLVAYTFLEDYFRGMEAVTSNKMMKSHESLQAALITILKLQQTANLRIEEPFALECLEAVLKHETIIPESKQSAYDSLKDLRVKFNWLLAKSDADRIDKALLTRP